MGKSMHKGHYGHYSGNSKFSKRKDEDYDAKEAYNKNLTASARLHYLENDRHDHESPANNIIGAAGKAAKMAAKAAQSYKIAKVREQAKEAMRNMRLSIGGENATISAPSSEDLAQMGKGSSNKKLRAGADTNYDRRDPDSYFYDEDFAADAGPRKSKEELEKERAAARQAAINKQK